MIHEFTIRGRRVKTGDVLSTSDGTNSIFSLGYGLLGKMIPGAIDHSVLYLGPEGLCMEAGIYGVITFDASPEWNSDAMFSQRGLLDTFQAASAVLQNRSLPEADERDIRLFRLWLR